MDEVNAENKEENKEETTDGDAEAGEKSPKKKMRLSFPSNCFRKPKKDLQGQEKYVFMYINVRHS